MIPFASSQLSNAHRTRLGGTVDVLLEMRFCTRSRRDVLFLLWNARLYVRDRGGCAKATSQATDYQI